MNKAEFYAAWLAALRSGEYEQGRGCLSDNGKFCCLGVACDIAVKQEMGVWRTVGGCITFVDETMDTDLYNLHDRSNSGTLTRGLAELLGTGEVGEFTVEHIGDVVRDSDGLIAPGENRGLEHWLTALNDEGFTFAQIADLIEYFFAPKSVSLDK